MEEGGSHGRDQAAAKAKPKKKSEAEVRVELVQAQRHHRELGKTLVRLPLRLVESRLEASKQLGCSRLDLDRSAKLVDCFEQPGLTRLLEPQRC